MTDQTDDEAMGGVWEHTQAERCIRVVDASIPIFQAALLAIKSILPHLRSHCYGLSSTDSIPPSFRSCLEAVNPADLKSTISYRLRGVLEGYCESLCIPGGGRKYIVISQCSLASGNKESAVAKDTAADELRDRIGWAVS
jgi:hypothetical protein